MLNRFIKVVIELMDGFEGVDSNRFGGGYVID